MKWSGTLAIRMTLESLARITLVGLRQALSPQSCVVEISSSNHIKMHFEGVGRATLGIRIMVGS